MDNCCEGKGHHGFCGVVMALIGVLMLINLFVWPRWYGFDGWMGFFAVLLILGGILKSMLHGGCCKGDKTDSCCNTDCCKTEPKVEPVIEATPVVVKTAKKKK